MLQLGATRSQDRLERYFDRVVLGPRLLVIDEIGDLSFGREKRTLSSRSWSSATNAVRW